MSAAQCVQFQPAKGKDVALSQLAADDSIASEVIDPRAGTRWDSLVQGHPDATVFHSTEWARVLCQTYSHQPVYLIINRGDQLVALVPMMEVSSVITGRRGVSLPFTDVCCPLQFEESDSCVLRDVICAEAKKRQWKHVEVRDAGRVKESSSASSQIVGHTLELQRSPNEMFDRFEGSVRTAIRKAERSGVTVRVATDRAGMLEYYRLHALTRRRHGLPPQPFSFFENIRSELMAKGHGFIVIASMHGRAIAGAVFLHRNGTAIYKFGASDDAGRRYCANNLALWEGIKQLSEKGLTRLHFGRSEVHNESLLRFKRAWGTSEFPVEYLRIDPISGASLSRKDLTSGFHTRVFQKLPLSINRLLGRVLYSHLD